MSFSQQLKQTTGAGALAGLERKCVKAFSRAALMQPEEQIDVELVIPLNGSAVCGTYFPVRNLGPQRLGARKRGLDVNT